MRSGTIWRHYWLAAVAIYQRPLTLCVPRDGWLAEAVPAVVARWRAMYRLVAGGETGRAVAG